MRASSVPDTLVAMTNMLPIVLDTAQDRVPIFLEFWLQASRDETIRQAIVAPYRHYRDQFAALIDEGIAEGSYQPVDSQATAQVIVSMAVGLLLQGILDPGSADWQKVAEQNIQFLTKSLAKP
jgi:hypothetical protein